MGTSVWNIFGADFVERTFKALAAFNWNLSAWDTSKVKDMSEMFDCAFSFN